MYGEIVWSKYNFIIPNKKLRYGTVPHIDFVFFGPGKQFDEIQKNNTQTLNTYFSNLQMNNSAFHAMQFWAFVVIE